MNRRFKRYADSLDASLNRLLRMKPVKLPALPRQVPDAGIYLFSERGRHLYVGRSNRMRSRLLRHGRPSAGHNRATFAFRLARHRTGITKPAYKSEGSRSQLLSRPKSRKAFSKAKDRIRRMDVRYVEEVDPPAPSPLGGVRGGRFRHAVQRFRYALILLIY